MGPLPGPSVGRAKHETTSVLVQPFSVQLRPRGATKAERPTRIGACNAASPYRCVISAGDSLRAGSY
jgi:hypothetical protein